ncbi:MAG TPA: HAD family phosphatase [Candidatus Acidoferrales bacterium]|nr:HAD family phosphatase [Candidatus Acidoferrales bacterium]
MITAVIFDLDGLLADTEPVHCRAYQDVLERAGARLTESDYIEHWVRAGKGIAEWIAARRLGHDPLELRRRKALRYLELLPLHLRAMDGGRELLARLHGRKKLALASSSYRDAVDAVLAGLEIGHYFAAVVSGLDVKNVKPAPDIFLAAAARLGAAPRECLVVEDAEKGVLAAYEAGMRCIAVPNDYTRHHDFSKATRVCSSLREISLELIDSLDRTID